jgi:hypothetical protein
MRTSRASVGHTSERTAGPPICVGHIDIRAQAELRSALKSDTPALLRANRESAEVERTGGEEASTRILVGVKL